MKSDIECLGVSCCKKDACSGKNGGSAKQIQGRGLFAEAKAEFFILFSLSLSSERRDRDS